MHGIPISIKDNIHVKNLRSTAGSSLFKEFKPDVDATVVEKLRSAGAIIIGKNNMHELAYGTQGNCSYFGSVKNPRDQTKSAGGSSSGSGAAVASNTAFGSIGTDTGGSIRIPSSFCGVVGIKPTYGLVSKKGTIPLSYSLDHVGPITRTVKDNAILLNAIAGYDAQDKSSVDQTHDDFTENIGRSVKNLTVGLPVSYHFDTLQSPIRRSIEQTINDCEKLGINVKEVRVNALNDLAAAYKVIIATESLSVYEGDLRYRPKKINAEIRGRLIEGVDIAAIDYLRALKIREFAIRELMDVFSGIDVLLTPSVSILPPEIDQSFVEINGENISTEIMIHQSRLMNVTGFPALSVPGIEQDNMPVGVQLIGQPFSERKLYQLAYAIESMYRI